jgi:hypothetical protein
MLRADVMKDTGHRALYPQIWSPSAAVAIDGHFAQLRGHGARCVASSRPPCSFMRTICAARAKLSTKLPKPFSNMPADSEADHQKSSIGDRVSLHLTDIDTSADVGSAIIEDRFDVK